MKKFTTYWKSRRDAYVIIIAITFSKIWIYKNIINIHAARTKRIIIIIRDNIGNFTLFFTVENSLKQTRRYLVKIIEISLFLYNLVLISSNVESIFFRDSMHNNVLQVHSSDSSPYTRNKNVTYINELPMCGKASSIRRAVVTLFFPTANFLISNFLLV